MQRKSSVSQRRSLRLLTLFILLALLTSLGLPVFGQEAAPADQPAGPIQILEFTGDDVKDAAVDGKESNAGFLFVDVPAGMSLFGETEPNDTAATANALPGSQVVVLGNISPAVDVDYFSFTANTGDRVYAATMTQFSNGGSTDTLMDVIASDGTTILETDDDSGTFSGTSSAIGGTIIPAAGTYYVRVDGFSTTSTIAPYHLHVRVQSGTPTAEVEPNNDLATATPLAASGWMSGTITAIADPDLFSFSLNAGDSVFLGLDMDPGRIPSNTNWNGRLGLGVFNNFLLIANDGSTTKPHAEAFFMTVQEAGTYYAYVDSAVATGLGPNARYNLSVSIYPKQVQQNCTTITSTDVPKLIGPGVGTATSTIVVPGTVTSSITDINATIVLTHSLMADLDVTLVGPTAASTALFTDIGSTATGGQTVMDAGLDDQAALPIGPFIVVKDIIYQPEQPGRLATFNGLPAAGTWTLQLADDAANTSGGRLQSWSLEICGDPPPAYGIELNKTVGLDPMTCATTDSVTVPPGGYEVFYCYTARNTGLNALTSHDLVDSELGQLLDDYPYSLAPGATTFITQSAMVDVTTVNTATWTASSGNNTASDSDTATVNVPQLCPAGFRDVTVNATFFDNPFPPAGWSVTNTSVGCVAPGLPDWTNTNPGARANLTGGVGPFAIADSDRCGSGSTLDTIMTTGMLNFTGLISPTVSFNTDYDDLSVGGVNDQAILDASTDGGATWSNLFTWDSDHRGPLLVNQALPGAGENDVQVRWHYASGTWDWWWQVDNAFITACEPVPANPAISLAKTVGTNPAVCATTDEISLPPGGGEVTYCYEVTNTGDVTFERHDLVDSELGTVLNNFPYTLAPGASAFLTATTTITVTTVNTATWTAYNPVDGGPVGVTATDTATVTLDLPAPAIVLTKTVGTDATVCATTDDITVPANTDVTYCYTVENTGNVSFNTHDLNDSELGVLLNNYPVDLAPGASVFITATTNITVTTVNTATWYAELLPQEGFPSAQATDVATVTVQAPNTPAINLNKTVGTVPGVCATTNKVTVPYGTEVYYCYQIENTGNVTMTVHSLVDDQLGILANNMPYVLAPGAFSPEVIVPDTAVITVTNTATWTAASSVGYVVNTNAAYNYIPINTTGTALALTDDAEANITIPWGATFFGFTSSNLRVANNGVILFNATTGDVSTLNAALPNATLGLAIAPFWDDIDADTGDVYWEVQGTTPNRMLIVEWYNRPHFSNIGSATFEAILYEATNEIKFQYADVDFGDPTLNNGASATVGVNNNATTALQVSFNQPVIQNGQAILFSPVTILTATDSDFAEVNVQIPNIDVDPLSMSATQATNTTTNQTLNVGNTGNAPLTWEIAETQPDRPARAGAQAAPEPVFDVPAAVTSEKDCAAFENYPGTEPEGWAEFCGQPAATPASSPSDPTSTGYTLNLRTPDRNLKRFTLNNFPGQTVVGPQAANIYGMDFDSTATTLYALNDLATDELGTLNTATGVFTPIVACPAPAAGTWTGLSIDPVTDVFYASTAANLYTLNPATCSPTLIGAFGIASGIMIDIAVNPAGVMYGHDIFTDSIYTINTTTGAATLVGLTGYAANFAQGMDFDNEDGTLYIFLYVGTGVNHYGTVNLATGAVTALASTNPTGEFEGATQTLGLCIPNDYGWLSTSPISGTTAANSVTPVTVTFDSTALANGVYTGQLCIRSNDPDNGPGNETSLVQVPVTLTVEAVTVPNIDVSPLSLASTQATNTTTNQPLTVANTGGGTLNWQIAEDTVLVTPVGPAPEIPAPAAGTTGSRGGTAGGPAPIAYDSPADFSEGFEDITVLPGWATQNNSSPLGLTNWFQGNDTVFPAQAGSTTSYIGANFNNTSGTGTISNWLMTPQITMNNGDTVSFWTSTAAGSIWPDRLQVRLSTAGASTNVGTLATDVGDFTTLLLDINPTLSAGGYPEAWTQYTITLSGLPANASGRIAWRYFVTGGGPSGANSNYIGIDTVEYTAAQAAVCDAPSAIPWLSETPSSGATPGGGSTPVTIGFDSTGLAVGTYTANLCITSDDPDPGPGNGTGLVIVPVTLTVQQPTAVTLSDISAAPLPVAGLPLAALPALVSLALGAAYALRRRQD